MKRTKSKVIDGSWMFEYGAWTYMHIVDPKSFSDQQESEDVFKRHLLLEFLDYLKVIEYTRGYDGIYYDIRIKPREK